MNVRSHALSLAMSLCFTVGACATTQPVMQQSGDTAVSARVGSRLIADPDVQRFDIDVDTIAGVVYLRGKVDTQTAKTSAERIARSTDGVQNVVNELKVDATTKGDATDGDVGIKTRVGRALAGDDDVRRVNIDVDVIDGVVTLSGVVHNEAEREQAASIAGQTEGVLGVKNELTVESGSAADSEKLGKVDDDGDRKKQ